MVWGAKWVTEETKELCGNCEEPCEDYVSNSEEM